MNVNKVKSYRTPDGQKKTFSHKQITKMYDEEVYSFGLRVSKVYSSCLLSITETILDYYIGGLSDL